MASSSAARLIHPCLQRAWFGSLFLSTWIISTSFLSHHYQPWDGMRLWVCTSRDRSLSSTTNCSGRHCRLLGGPHTQVNTIQWSMTKYCLYMVNIDKHSGQFNKIMALHIRIDRDEVVSLTAFWLYVYMIIYAETRWSLWQTIDST